MRWIAAIASLLMAINSAALGGIIVTGQRDDRVLISNPPSDWHSPAGARYSLDWFSGGLDAGKAGDAEGYRLFGGSRLERNDDELAIPLRLGNGVRSLNVVVDALAAGKEVRPLQVLLNDRAVGEASLAGEKHEHVVTRLTIALKDGDGRGGYHLLRLVNPVAERAVFVDAVQVPGADVRSEAPMHVVGANGSKYVLPRSVRQDGSFRLWRFGRYLQGCTERRSYHREQFRVGRNRIKLRGYRQVDGAHDTWHNLYEIKRDSEGRQIENWAELGRRWHEVGCDTPASDQTRGFQIGFDSPCGGKGRLVLQCIPSSITASIIVVMNGDSDRARIGVGRRGSLSPSGLMIEDKSAEADLAPGQITVYPDLPVRVGRNIIDLDYAGQSFCWPGKTYPGLAESLDYISFELRPDVPLPDGPGAPFREPPLAGERFAEPADIAVDLDTRWTRRGRSAIPKGLFGITTYSVGRTLVTAEKWRPLKHINIGCVNGGLSIGCDWPAEKEGQPVDAHEVWEQCEERWSSDRRARSGALLTSYVKAMNAAHEVGIDCHVAVAMGGGGRTRFSATPRPPTSAGGVTRS